MSSAAYRTTLKSKLMKITYLKLRLAKIFYLMKKKERSVELAARTALSNVST